MMSNLNLLAMSRGQLVTHALVLGLTAPSDEQMRQCADMAEYFAVGLSVQQLEQCKAAALEMADGKIGGAT
jgi:hypothetical protein